jgi:parallel beta-helix repeat protein
MSMARNIGRAIVELLTLGTAMVTFVAAGEGRIPIFAPTSIVADGRYIVTRDIGPAPTAIITVSSPNVDIDLNGFTLDNSGTPNPVISVPGPVETIVIRHGILKGGMAGIDVPFGGAPKVVLEDLKIQSPSGFGIHLMGPINVEIRRNLINSSTGSGIQIDPIAGFITTGVIEGNGVQGAGALGIAIQRASALSIINNRIDVTSDMGIGLGGSDGCLLEDNTIEKAGKNGIELAGSGGNKLVDNVVRSAGWHGIHLDPGSSNNLIVREALTLNGAGLPGGHGLFVESSSNYIEHCLLNSNSGAGLYFTPPATLNTFGRNTARSNSGVGVGACPLLFPPNSCDFGGGNTSDSGNLIPGPPIF